MTQQDKTNAKFYVVSVDMWGHEYDSYTTYPLTEARRMANLMQETMFDKGRRMCVTDVRLRMAKPEYKPSWAA